MLNVEKIKFRTIALAIIIWSLFSYLPVLLLPSSILNRSSDLDLYFWPLFIYIKHQIFYLHAIPLWNEMYLSGTPLISNPQSPIFYPPNVIFLFLPIGAAFVVTFLLHSIWGGIGMYLLGREALKFSKLSSLFAALLYIISPKVFGYLQAGHFGLVLSFAWIPWVLLACCKLANLPQKKWIAWLAVSGAGVYLNHAITAVILGVFSLPVFFYLVIKSRKLIPTKFFCFALGWTLSLGLCAVTLLPQVVWSPLTTRVLLTLYPDTYPKWSGLKDFLLNLLVPWLKGAYPNDSEKWVATGIILTGLSIYGLKQVPYKKAAGLMATILIVILVSLNNSSPVYKFLIKQDWYLVLRVGTRVWFVVTIIVILLAGWSCQLLKKTRPVLAMVLIVLALTESAALSWTRVLQSPPSRVQPAPEELIKFLIQDHDHYRVFCLDRCITQKQAAENNLELVEGYDTLIQLNYYKEAWQLMGAYWNYYTLSVPPFGTIQFQQLKPDLVSLGKYNVKYIISPYTLDNLKRDQIYQIQGLRVYINPFYLPRSYYYSHPGNITYLNYYSANAIRVNTQSHPDSRLVLANVYSPGWKAYLNGTEYTPVLEMPDALSLVNLKPNTQFVDFIYQPDSFNWGVVISIISLLAVCYLVLSY